jgi:hypothetical protein
MTRPIRRKRQQSTQDQIAALRAMNEWRAQTIKIARVALRGQKHLLEKIGVTAHPMGGARVSHAAPLAPGQAEPITPDA